ncbi:kinase-like protein [Rhizopogon salebrosus TDB-379]|nr:kinase-like protein [Rhizopogon salebrosus TDB-379]
MGLHHPNIISLLGITRGFRGASFPSLVFPWMPKGDLDCYIAYYGAGIETSVKLSVSRDIASGVAYLHSFPVVHGNLESKNVLLGPENRAYLTGFSSSTVLGGMSDDCFKSPEKPQPGRVQFTAPECFTEGGPSLPSVKRDIYSFSYILFHVFSGCLPWHDLLSSDIINEVRRGRMPSRPSGGGIDDSLWAFIKRCCSISSNGRPSADEVVTFLKKYRPPSKAASSPDDLTRMLPAFLPKVIDSGGYADIRKCTLTRDGGILQVVAVKSIRHQNRDPFAKTQKRYARELGNWARLMHENILPLLGTAGHVYATHGCDAWVCPWMENGTLETYLGKYSAMALPQKLRLLRDVAAGLRYLHSENVAHADLTDRNILVDINGRAVVADFGLSFRLSDLSENSHSVTPTARWMAPELTAAEGHRPTKESDMYSFGTIMNYVLSPSLEKPFEKYQNPQVWAALSRMEAPFPTRGKDISGGHWKFIQQCLVPHNSTTPRPSAEDAYKFLQRELGSIK